MSRNHAWIPVMVTLGLLLCRPRIPLAEDVQIFRELVGESEPATLMTWGLRYKEGDGVARNIDRAIRLYCKAARDGHPDAQFQLGLIYAKENAIAQHQDLASAWFRLAAEQRHGRAAELLVMMAPKRKYARAACILRDGSDLFPPPPPKVVRLAPRGGGRCSLSQGCSAPRIGTHPATGEVASLVRELAPGYRLDPNLVLAVIEAESGFNPGALSPKNAQGLMQLIPATAARFGVANVWDPEQNVRGGMAYLKWLMSYFDGDLELVLAAYNSGEGAVQRYGGVPPYTETRGYVARILARLGN